MNLSNINNHGISESCETKRLPSNPLYRSLFDYHPDLVFSLDLNGNLLEANRVFSKVLGYSGEEIGGPFKRFLPAEELDPIREYYYKAVDGEPQNVDTLCIHKDGHFVDLNVTIIPMVSNDTVIGVYAIAKDITKTRRFENRYKSLFTNIHEAAFVLDMNGNIIDVNQAAIDMTGYSREEVIDRHFAPIICPEDLNQVLKQFDQVINGVSLSVEFSVFHKEGYKLDFLNTTVPIYIQNQIVGAIGICKDITEDKRLPPVKKRRI